jgi:hypothetical protein
MLEVHPPHHALNTWRDFIIHIATIVVGLCIAVGIEQVVEYFHHRHQRHQLQEDLRAEAEKRIPLIESNLKNYAISTAWYSEILRLGHAATPSGGFVTFVLPSRPQFSHAHRPEDAVWASAKASGTVNVLSHEETETWGRVDYYAEHTVTAIDALADAVALLHAVTDRTGVSLKSGATVRLTPAECDEFLRAVAFVIERTWIFTTDDASWAGASDAVLHGANTVEEMAPYIERAISATR